LGDWREQILKKFAPQVARLTLAADPDGLLTEEGVLKVIRSRGFDVLLFEDHIAFRYAFESKYRTRWDRSERIDLVVVLQSGAGDLDSLPYDLLRVGRKLTFGLAVLFPNLSYPVVAALDRGDLDVLYEAQQRQGPGNLGENATKDFALRHVFGIAPELVRQPSALLQVLLRRHYRSQRIPEILESHFVQVLRQGGQFGGWPLERIVPDREVFLAFLQERWPLFLKRAAGSPKEPEGKSASYAMAFSGPTELPFEHDDVRVYIDNLFLEGLLEPVVYEHPERFAGQWMTVGVQINPKSDVRRRFDGLLKAVQETLPGSDAKHKEWLQFAPRWGELTALWFEIQSDVAQETAKIFLGLRDQIDSLFLSWVQERYAGLHFQPPSPPVVIHHVPRALERNVREDGKGRVALVVIDGLALDQWVVLRDVLQVQRPQFVFREGAVFAWLPTMTSVSRQALFAGKPPLNFPNSIFRTDKESFLWTQFWGDHGLAQKEMGYLKGLGEGTYDDVVAFIEDRDVRALGLIVSKIDRIMHGMELGSVGMQNQVRLWATQGYMAGLLDILLDSGFYVTIVSDHGNVEAEGIGLPSEGSVADLRGERVRVYPDDGLRASVKAKYLDAIEWPAIGVPEDFLSLIAPGRKAFVNEGKRVVTHGGISIEEVVVPLVQVERSKP